MTQAPISLFVNPTAGRGRAGKRLKVVQELFAARAIPLQVIVSEASGHMEDQVARKVSMGARNIVVVGGDGSVHEAVNGLQKAGERCTLSVIPSGTGNDFAKACEIPPDWRQATTALLQRLASNEPARSIDIGRVNDRYFANGVGIGFDAKVTRIARTIRLPIGNIVYLLALLRCLKSGVTTPELHIRGEQVRFRGAVTLATVCNGPWVGGLFHIAPMADNADQQLDLLIATPVSRARVLALLPLLMRGEHVTAPEVSQHSIDRLIITSDAPVESHVDGEVQPPLIRFEFELLPGALRLL